MIKVLQAHHYVNALDDQLNREGQRGWTWFATLRDEKGKDFNAAVKLYPAEFQNKSLLGEVIGHLVAKETGVDVPEQAGFIFVPAKVVSKFVGQEVSENGLAWYSSLVGTTPKFQIENENRLLESVRKELEAWPGLSQCLNNDEWLCNQDRNLGNLCVSSKGKISVIDHGQLPIRENWLANQLDPEFSPKSKLAKAIWGTYFIHELNWPDFQRVKLLAKKNPDSFDGLSSQIEHWAKVLLLEDEMEVNSLMEFLEHRAHNGGSRLAKLANVMDI